MKKSIYSIFTLAIVMVMFASCGKDNPIIPGGGDGDGTHAELWKYEAPIKGLADIIPAIDENGNIYIAGQAEGAAGGVCSVVSVDKDGKERWTKTFEDADPTNVIYADGKVFFGLSNPVKVYALDASSGSTLWSKDLSADYDFDRQPVMAFANQKLYMCSGQFVTGILIAYNPTDGAELWIKNLYDTWGMSIAVHNEHIYLNTSAGSLLRYDDNGSSCDSTWEFKAESTNRSVLEGNVCVVENGNVYFRDEAHIYIVDGASGTAITDIMLDGSFDNSSSSITVDGDGNCYLGNGNLNKFSASGSKVWETDITSGIINPNYMQAPTIGENGKFYNGELFSLSCVKSDGTLDWMLGTEQGVGNLHTVAINIDGNILSYATEKGVLYCYKGDGSKLATQGWAKRFGTMGNTCSK